MDAVVYTMDGQEYEMLSGILKEESPGLTDDPWFARATMRTHIFDFTVRPFKETRFREALKRIKEGDIAVWQKIPVKTSVYQGGCISKGNVLERRNGTIWKRIREYFLSENTL